MIKGEKITRPGQPKLLFLAFAGAILFFLFCAFALVALPVKAATTIGSGTPESCTIESLDAALAAGGVINFDCGAAPYSFPITNLKVIAVDATLDGTGPGITFDANKDSNQYSTGSIFKVNSDVTFTIENLSIINAKSPTNGAGINAQDNSTLVINNVVFNNNISSEANDYEGGGAIFLGPGAAANIDGSTFSYNKAPSGGAIASRDSVSLIISGTTFLGNEATGSDGGAIYSHSVPGAAPPMTFLLENSKVNANVARTQGGGLSVSYLNATQSAEFDNVDIGNNNAGVISNTNGYGGGIYVEQGELSVRGSAIYNNAVTTNGGGIYIGKDTTVNPYVTIQNSSIGNNQAYNSGSHGGGIYHMHGTLILTAVTIASNTSQNSGGGLFTGSTNEQIPEPGITLANSIVAGNSTGTDSFFGDCSDIVADGGYNIQSAGTTQNCTSSVVKANPQLTTLNFLGGPTPTYGLKAGSPALDAIPAGSCAVSQDQRGFDRPYNNRCDIGAFEGVVQPPALVVSFSPSMILSGTTTTLTFGVTTSSSPDTVISGIAFKDNLPANLKVAPTPNITTNCAGPLGSPNVSITNSNGTINVSNLNLTSGQLCIVSVDVVNSPASTSPITTTVGQVSYLNGDFIAVNSQATLNFAGADSLVVTQTSGDGPGSLTNALSSVESTTSKTILLSLPKGSTINISTPATLTVGKDVKIYGRCDYPFGPGITINGAKFLLEGNVTLNGIKLIGPDPGAGVEGPILKNDTGLPTLGTNNHLACVSVKTAP